MHWKRWPCSSSTSCVTSYRNLSTTLQLMLNEMLVLTNTKWWSRVWSVACWTWNRKIMNTCTEKSWLHSSNWSWTRSLLNRSAEQTSWCTCCTCIWNIALIGFFDKRVSKDRIFVWAWDVVIGVVFHTGLSHMRADQHCQSSSNCLINWPPTSVNDTWLPYLISTHSVLDKNGN
jgi:hypothetical protein